MLTRRTLDASPFFFVTLVIGWFIWFAIVAPRGQTPAKALLSTYVVRSDGSVAGGWYMWGRELGVKMLLFGVVDSFTFRIPTLLGSMWILWDRDKQALWDKVVRSYVAYSPDFVPSRQYGEQRTASAPQPNARLQELQQLRAEGIITAEEYEERRQRLVDSV